MTFDGEVFISIEFLLQRVMLPVTIYYAALNDVFDSFKACIFKLFCLSSAVKFPIEEAFVFC